MRGPLGAIRGEADGGAGTALAVATVAAVVVVASTMLPLTLGFAKTRTLAATADSAALAAADTASGALAGYPCEAAASAVLIGGGELVECRVDGAIASVTVADEILGVRAESKSRAGPPTSAEAGRARVGGRPHD